jgi:hypothetical protein
MRGHCKAFHKDGPWPYREKEGPGDKETERLEHRQIDEKKLKQTCKGRETIIQANTDIDSIEAENTVLISL